MLGLVKEAHTTKTWNQLKQLWRNEHLDKQYVLHYYIHCLSDSMCCREYSMYVCMYVVRACVYEQNPNT